MFACQWAFSLLPYLGYCKQCYNEHWGVCIFFKLEFSSFLDICPGVGWLDHMETLFWVFFRNFHTFFHSAWVYIPNNSMLLLLLLSRFSPVWLCVTLEMAAHQAPPSPGFSRQEHQSGLPFPSPMHESEKWKWSRSVVSDS